MRKVTRRRILAAASALPLFGIQSWPAGAAEFKLKFATGQDPSHPVNKRAQEAIDRIKEATGGRVEINLFPANQLGSDTDLIGQLRFGAVDILNIAGVVLATFVPRAGIVATGFAFPSYDVVWKAMDGAFGAYVKGEIEVARATEPRGGDTSSPAELRELLLRARTRGLVTLRNGKAAGTGEFPRGL
jgi:TRAP-type C4-dicarboxylate transport system substrate-binding protein